MFEISDCVCNNDAWGYMGRNGISPLEMGIGRGGRVSRYPHSHEIAENGKPDSPQINADERGFGKPRIRRRLTLMSQIKNKPTTEARRKAKTDH